MSSKSHMPPVPPENQSRIGGNAAGEGKLPPEKAKGNADSTARDPNQQGHQGATWQGTHHQGYQQDR